MLNKLLDSLAATIAPLTERAGINPRTAVTGVLGFAATVLVFVILRRLFRPKKRAASGDEIRLLEQCLTEQSLKILRLENEARKKARQFERRLAAAERRAQTAEDALARIGREPPFPDPPPRRRKAVYDNE